MLKEWHCPLQDRHLRCLEMNCRLVLPILPSGVPHLHTDLEVCVCMCGGGGLVWINAGI